VIGSEGIGKGGPRLLTSAFKKKGGRPLTIKLYKLKRERKKRGGQIMIGADRTSFTHLGTLIAQKKKGANTFAGNEKKTRLKTVVSEIQTNKPKEPGVTNLFGGDISLKKPSKKRALRALGTHAQNRSDEGGIFPERGSIRFDEATHMGKNVESVPETTTGDDLEVREGGKVCPPNRISLVLRS